MKCCIFNIFFCNKTKPVDHYNNQGSKMKSDNPRPNRWIPVEVWQSKGITAHEMTLPQGIKSINKINNILQK